MIGIAAPIMRTPMLLRTVPADLDLSEVYEPADVTHNALAGLIWVNARFDEPGDADDFVQTILVANSLLKCGGFDHADIVHVFEQPHQLR